MLQCFCFIKNLHAPYYLRKWRNRKVTIQVGQFYFSFGKLVNEVCFHLLISWATDTGKEGIMELERRAFPALILCCIEQVYWAYHSVRLFFESAPNIDQIYVEILILLFCGKCWGKKREFIISKDILHIKCATVKYFISEKINYPLSHTFSVEINIKSQVLESS